MSSPTNHSIESALRDAVVRCFRENDLEALTLKRVRVVVAERLDLPEEFFKTDARWKEKSKEVVNEEVARQEAQRDDDPESSPVAPRKRNAPKAREPSSVDSTSLSPAPSPSPPPQPKAKPKPAPRKPSASAGTKRKSPELKKQPARKRRKAVSSSESELTPAEDSSSALSDAPSATESDVDMRGGGAGGNALDSDLSEVPDEPAMKRKAARNRQAVTKAAKKKNEDEEAHTSGSDTSVVLDQPPTKGRVTQKKDTTTKATSKKAEDEKVVDPSESEMSVVLDEPPPKRRAPKKKEATTKAPAKSATTTKPSTATPQEEEIKRLQGWLVKCGVRKLWGKELAPFSTPREKISHLKQMLSDAGMSGGRYSEQRARQIRDERELKADLDDIKEREKIWGESSGGEDDDGDGEEKRPRRRLAKGLRELQDLASEEDSG